MWDLCKDLLWGIVSFGAVVFIVGVIIKLFLQTKLGAFVGALIFFLFMMNCIIAFDTHVATIIGFNPFGFIPLAAEFIGNVIGSTLDHVLGIVFFKPIMDWFFGGITYMLIFYSLNYFCYMLLSASFRSVIICFLLYVLWLIAFHYLYFYPYMGDNVILKIFTVPSIVPPHFKTYYYVGIAIPSLHALMLTIRNKRFVDTELIEDD